MKGGDRVEKNSKGFTLIEMCVVMVLICLLGVALIPSMGLVYKQEVRKAADIMCADLTMMRKETGANGKAYSLSMNSGGNGYSIAPGFTTSRTGNAKDGISPNVTYSIVENYDGGTSASTNTIYYSGGKLVDGLTSTANQVSQLSICIGYDGAAERAEIIYDGFTGGYSMAIRP